MRVDFYAVASLKVAIDQALVTKPWWLATTVNMAG